MGGQSDVVIAGGGAAGLALALALRSASGGVLSVAVHDPALAREIRGDSRAYAIVAGARRFLSACGAWAAMADEAEPILGMDITDSHLAEPFRPQFLAFDTSGVAEGEPFAHMVPNRAILRALTDAARAAGVGLFDTAVTGLARSAGQIEAVLADGSVPCRLLVAADGKASRLRAAAGLSFYGWDYPQSGIAATISHSLPHEGRAVQNFLPSGPFAMLPLRGNRSSIVWTERHEVAARMIAGDRDDLLMEIDRRSGGRFGVVTAVEGAAAFPLSLGVARRFIQPRLALLGDAAHAMHPLAGQGLNYGLRGAAALAETILDAARLGCDIGAEDALEAYDVSRRADVIQMLAATDGLNRLFSNDSAILRPVRDAGLGLVDRLPFLKDRLIGTAAGVRGAAPRAFRGQAL